MSNGLNEWKRQELERVFGSGTKEEEIATLSGRDVELRIKERDELKAQLEEYEQLNMMQLEAGARAANLYNEKHGTDIWQLDLARGTVFLMEQNDELQAQVAVLRKGMEAIADTTSHKRAVQLAIRFVATTPADAAERVQMLVEALEEVEKMGTYKNADFTSEDSQEEPWAVIAGNALSEWRRQT